MLTEKEEASKVVDQVIGQQETILSLIDDAKETAQRIFPGDREPRGQSKRPELTSLAQAIILGNDAIEDLRDLNHHLNLIA